jgi:type VI secretion system VasD/TssJ family lipoprotein
MIVRSRHVVLFLACILIMIGGCSSPVEMMIQGNDQMNGGGNPAVVRIYQLSGEVSFTQATAEVFWEDDIAQVSGELIGRPQDLTIFPGESRTIEIEPSENAQFIGFAADLRNPTPNRWRSIHAVSDLKGKEVTVEILEDRLDVTF